MGRECFKSTMRRVRDPLFHQSVFVGDVLDVGSGDDPLSLFAYMFPRIRSVRDWYHDPDGDGMTLPGLAPASFDTVHASHVLEHLDDPIRALVRWAEVLRMGGHVVALLPEAIMYEHGQWPSRNNEHQNAFTSGRGPHWATPLMGML